MLTSSIFIQLLRAIPGCDASAVSENDLSGLAAV